MECKKVMVTVDYTASYTVEVDVSASPDTTPEQILANAKDYVRCHLKGMPNDVTILDRSISAAYDRHFSETEPF